LDAFFLPPICDHLISAHLAKTPPLWYEKLGLLLTVPPQIDNGDMIPFPNVIAGILIGIVSDHWIPTPERVSRFFTINTIENQKPLLLLLVGAMGPQQNDGILKLQTTARFWQV
jgi:hypothetical protein